jgi:diadenosine tetraphosphatase ApaH/serine/threonine PP2A family protein phosphatase
VIADAARERVDGWLFLGDAVGYGPQPNECVERLAALPNLLGVRGNHDHMACFGIDSQANGMARMAMAFTRLRLSEAASRWLQALPIEQVGDTWLAVHGAPVDPQRFHAYVYAMSCRRNLEHLSATPQRWCFHGHTHVPMVYRRTQLAEAELLRPVDRTRAELRGAEAMLINPGSVGQPRDGDARAGYGIWDCEAGCVEFRRIAYDLAPVLAAIRALGLPDDLALRLELGR